MIKALLKKQLLEVFSWLYVDKKSGKSRSKNGIIIYVLLYVVLFCFLGGMFFTMALPLCEPLVTVGLGWLYFALMSLMAVAFGVFGSVFSTYSSMYLAKDNDLLLSMPIPPSIILFVRLCGVYLIGLMYELIVMIPTVIVYFMFAKSSLLSVLFSLLIPLVLSVFVLTLSCLLGFAVAAISSRLKNKSIITVILSLAFIAGYYYVYSQAYTILQAILANPTALGSKVKSFLYPFYHMGLAAEGNALSMLIFTAIIAALFGFTYFILSRSFIKIATAKNGGKRTKYKEKAAKVSNVGSALLKKEFLRFVASPTYMLNCGLGIVLMPIAAVALIIKSDWMNELIMQLGLSNSAVLPLLIAAAVCMISSLNDITAPSVSLEGKQLWLLKAYPVAAKAALHAKLKMHLILSLIPALILTVAALIIIKATAIGWVLVLITVTLFIILTALFGLFMGLKMPNLNWTEETVPVKQSLSVTIALFSGWIAVIALGGLYFAISSFIAPEIYMCIVAVLLGVLSALLFRWINTKGAKLFAEL